MQTDAPLKRIVNLYGGMRMAKSSLEQYGYQLDPTIERHFSEYRKTHNEGVFDAYPERTRVARHVGLLTGLPAPSTARPTTKVSLTLTPSAPVLPVTSAC